MTPQQLKAMKLALEALEWIAAQRTGGMIQRKAMEPIVAIREVLKDHAMQEVQRLGQEIEQEPVAWMDADGNVSDNNDHKCFPIPLYTKEQP